MKCISDCDVFVGKRSITIKPRTPEADGYVERRYDLYPMTRARVTQKDFGVEPTTAIEPTTATRVRTRDVLQNFEEFLDYE